MITSREEAMEALQHSRAEAVFGVRLRVGRSGALDRASILSSYAHFKMALYVRPPGGGKEWERKQHKHSVEAALDST